MAIERQVAAEQRRRAPARGEDEEVVLLERIGQGDVRAFEALYRRYYPRLTRFLMQITRRPSLVDEVLNDALMVVWSRPEGFNGESKVSSWIFAIAYHKALKAMRKQDLPIEDEGGEERPSPDPGPEQQAGQRRVERALTDVLNELSAEHRAVVELTYFQEFGYREIAEILSCPVDTVKTRMFYARRRLGRLLPGTIADWL